MSFSNYCKALISPTRAEPPSPVCWTRKASWEPPALPHVLAQRPHRNRTGACEHKRVLLPPRLLRVLGAKPTHVPVTFEARWSSPAPGPASFSSCLCRGAAGGCGSRHTRPSTAGLPSPCRATQMSPPKMPPIPVLGPPRCHLPSCLPSLCWGPPRCHLPRPPANDPCLEFMKLLTFQVDTFHPFWKILGRLFCKFSALISVPLLLRLHSHTWWIFGPSSVS